MGTIYRTTCGCIASFPEPLPAEFDHEDEYQRALDRWVNAWATDADEHHPYCCQVRHRGDLVQCLEGLADDQCPQMVAQAAEIAAQDDIDEQERRLAVREGEDEHRYPRLFGRKA